jgi:hypothetical protein
MGKEMMDPINQDIKYNSYKCIYGATQRELIPVTCTMKPMTGPWAAYKGGRT